MLSWFNTKASSLLKWIGIGTDYLVAGGLVVGGAYLIFQFTINPSSAWVPFAKPFRAVGFALIAAGLVLGSVTYGRQSGATQCEAQWRAANLQAQIDRAKQEADAQKNAAALAQQQAGQLEEENAELQKQVGDYEKYIATVVAEQKAQPVPGCQLTADDVRQLRAIAGAIPARRKNTK